MDDDDFGDGIGDEEEVQEELDPDNPEHQFLLLERDFTKVRCEYIKLNKNFKSRIPRLLESWNKIQS